MPGPATVYARDIVVEHLPTRYSKPVTIYKLRATNLSVYRPKYIKPHIAHKSYWRRMSNGALRFSKSRNAAY
jgi:hypothetical protein